MKSIFPLVPMIFVAVFFSAAFADAATCLEGKYQIGLGSGFNARFTFRFTVADDGLSAILTSRGLNGGEYVAFADGVAPVHKVYPDLNETLTRLTTPANVFENRNRTLRAFYDGKLFHLAKAGDITPHPWSVTEVVPCK